MLLLYILILWQTQGVEQYQFNMYHTDYDRDGYCLLYYVFNHHQDYFHQSLKKRVHQIIPYCLRSSEENVLIAPLNSSTRIYSTITFAELREQNISSKLLISWFAPIEQAERYQEFLYDVSNSSKKANTLFYNCTFPWFGPFCRFAFDLTYYTADVRPLYAIVYSIFFSASSLSGIINVTCYKHHQCDTWLICLDWREICDGKMDCLDESDELNCWQLEMNECNKNEYRCYNGQCIPGSFYVDNDVDPDCLDRTDEYKIDIYPNYCAHDPSFRCEEHKCHPGRNEFSCGNGNCGQEMENCFNTRSAGFKNDFCTNAMFCLLDSMSITDFAWCEEYCPEYICIEKYCPPFFEFPPRPIFFGHVKFIYSREELVLARRFSLPKYICYNEQLCADFLPATVHLNGSTCRYLHELELNIWPHHSFIDQFQLIKTVFRACLMMSNQTHYVNQTMMYQCQNSRKYISKYHLLDRTVDCPFGDDETFKNESCLLNDTNYRFHCSIDNNELCFAPFSPGFTSAEKHEGGCTIFESYYPGILLRNEKIYFQSICDGLQDLLPIFIDGQNETDETGCEYWHCNNTYTRCDQFWSCKDGADEVNCPSSTCPEFYHSCVLLNDTKHVSCLHMHHAGDGIVDCLGATDEPNHCLYIDTYSFIYYFTCRDDTKCIQGYNLCDGDAQCHLGDDEIFCTNFSDLRCYPRQNLSEVEDFFCNFIIGERSKLIRFFKLRNIPTYSSQLNLSSDQSPLPNEKKVLPSQNDLMAHNTNTDASRCNRGLRIHIRTINKAYKLSCLCPPSYYGDQCQYQSQRVSLTVQIRATSDLTTLFTFLIFLIDSETNIESHDHIEYLPIRDCDIKFNIYLLYSTRPKNSSKIYSIRIDAFNRMEMTYRASWFFPLQFPFLPVHRLPVRLIIPPVNVEPLSQCPFPCIHGQCIRFVNDQNSLFCRCSPGWSGLQCTKRYLCNCESNSQCIDDSICLCPVDRYGPRCYLFQSSCHSESCSNGGRCIHADERYTYDHKNKSTCICPPEYFGDRCEFQRNRQTEIDISFDDSLIIPPYLIIHLIQVHDNEHPNQTSMMKKIGFDQLSLTFYTRITFHLAFAEMFQNYYLIILREEAIVLSHISTKIIPSQRCASINELFNETVVQLVLLRRIKLYHVPCQKQRELVCFYDSIHFCLCDHDRRANCFEFDHNDTYECDGYNLCGHGGQCFLDDKICPKLTICNCYPCYFGSKCQFSTQGSTLLLDIILGYRIQPKLGIKEQPNIIKIAIAFTTLIFTLGLIGNLCTFLTFQMKKTRNVGCGIYLFTSSIISLITICVLVTKFCVLLLSQMGSIKTRSFLQVQCISIDFLLRVLLVSGDWIYACVSIERAMTILQGINFNKLKSKKIAKWMLLLVFLCTSCTHIHDPIYRRLVEDEEEQRTWCITTYTSFLRIYDVTVNIIHFCVPFLINCISALVIIIVAARTRSKAQKNLPYKYFLREQFQQHKHLLISSFVLVILAIPRLLIAFLFGCMKSSGDSWLYLIGYYISFIPPMLTFIIFVLPSKLYIAEFKKSIKRFL